MKIQKDTMGRNAYKGSKVWKLGLHFFENGEDKIIRLCYWRCRRTHYIQVLWKFREEQERE